MTLSVWIGGTADVASAGCADSCEFPYVDGNCVVLGCCGGDGERQCCTGCIGSEAPSACKPGYVVEADALCHKPCYLRKNCSFPYGDGNCPALGCCGSEDERPCVVGPGSDAPSACAPGLVLEADIKCHTPCYLRNSCSFPYDDGNCGLLGCCGGEGERICLVGIGSPAPPSECAPGLITTALLTCERPRSIGEDCGPGFPCVDGLQCVPFAQKCAPNAGEQIIDSATCEALYSPDLAQAAIDTVSTMSYGISAGASAVVGGSYTIGNVYGEGGEYGCFLTYCYGVESDISIGSAVCTGIADSWGVFQGGSFVTVQSAGIGVEFTTSQSFTDLACFTADPSPPCLNGTESCIGVAVGVLPFSAGGYQCETIVNQILGGDPSNTPPVAACRDVNLTAGPMCGVSASIDNGSYDADAGDMVHTTQTPSGPYAAGETNVTLFVNDNDGAVSSCTGKVTVTDTTKPTISGCPSMITVYTGSGATQCAQTASWTEPTANDNCGIASFAPDAAPGSSFEVGDTTVTYTATDNAGLTETCSFTVRVIDDTLPKISNCPTGPVTASTGPSNALCSAPATWPVVSATDNCDLVLFTPSHASGSTFAVGQTTVFYTARDIYGNVAGCNFKVQVADTTPPKVTGCPSDATVYTGPAALTCTQTASWTPPSAGDNCGVTSFNPNHAPGSVFSLGETAVTYTAYDAAGNNSPCSFDITVVDNTPPAITCPDPIEVEALTSGGRNVSFTPIATDNCSVMVTSAPESGSLFPIGTTEVTSTAKDGANNQDSCSFDVHVIGADLLLEKTASPSPVIAGTDLTYTIDIVNNGPDPALNVEVVDSTPPGTTFKSVTSPTGWTCDVPALGGTGEISCTKSTVGDGETATFEVVVHVPSGTPYGAEIVNQAGVTSTTQDPNPDNNTSSQNTDVTTQADIVISGSDEPESASRSGEASAALAAANGGSVQQTLVPKDVRIAFTVTNNGPSDAQNVEVSLTTPQYTSFVAFWPPAGWTCVTPPVGGTGVVSCSIPTMVASQADAFVLILHVGADAPGGTQIVTTVTASTTTLDTELTNNAAAFAVLVFLPVPLLGSLALLAWTLLLLGIASRSLARR